MSIPPGIALSCPNHQAACAATTASSARGPCRMGRRRKTPCWRKRTVPTARAAATTLAPPLWDNHASFVRPPPPSLAVSLFGGYGAFVSIQDATGPSCSFLLRHPPFCPRLRDCCLLRSPNSTDRTRNMPTSSGRPTTREGTRLRYDDGCNYGNDWPHFAQSWRYL